MQRVITDIKQIVITLFGDSMEDQLQEAQEKYYSTQNRVNMQLVQQHKMRKEEKLFKEQLQLLQMITESINRGRDDPGYLSRAVLSEDEYLRNLIKENNNKIRELERRLKGSELLSNSEKIKEVHDMYSKVLSGDLEKKTRDSLSTLKGKVEETKKKTKELLKEIQSLEEGQKNYIDEYSLYGEQLEEEEIRIKKLRDELIAKREIKKEE